MIVGKLLDFFIVQMSFCPTWKAGCSLLVILLPLNFVGKVSRFLSNSTYLKDIRGYVTLMQYVNLKGGKHFYLQEGI